MQQAQCNTMQRNTAQQVYDVVFETWRESITAYPGLVASLKQVFPQHSVGLS